MTNFERRLEIVEMLFYRGAELEELEERIAKLHRYARTNDERCKVQTINAQIYKDFREWKRAIQAICCALYWCGDDNSTRRGQLYLIGAEIYAANRQWPDAEASAIKARALLAHNSDDWFEAEKLRANAELKLRLKSPNLNLWQWFKLWAKGPNYNWGQ